MSQSSNAAEPAACQTCKISVASCLLPLLPSPPWKVPFIPQNPAQEPRGPRAPSPTRRNAHAAGRDPADVWTRRGPFPAHTLSVEATGSGPPPPPAHPAQSPRAPCCGTRGASAPPGPPPLASQLGLAGGRQGQEGRGWEEGGGGAFVPLCFRGVHVTMRPRLPRSLFWCFDLGGPCDPEGLAIPGRWSRLTERGNKPSPAQSRHLLHGPHSPWATVRLPESPQGQAPDTPDSPSPAPCLAVPPVGAAATAPGCRLPPPPDLLCRAWRGPPWRGRRRPVLPGSACATTTLPAAALGTCSPPAPTHTGWRPRGS